MELRTYYAYNETRESILGLDVLALECSGWIIAQILARQTLKPGEGLWLKSFHDLPTTGRYNPFDLICLDEGGRVNEVVESLSTPISGSLIERAASALVLPLKRICSSEVQIGDQVLFGAAEEIEWLLEQRRARRNRGVVHVCNSVQKTAP